MNLQEEYDKIYSFFRTTTEPFDELDWDGWILKVFLNNNLIETYIKSDLKEFSLFTNTDL